jgi:5'-methylthioadenosine phosphorylase
MCLTHNPRIGLSHEKPGWTNPPDALPSADMSELRIGLIGGTGLGEALGAEGGQRHEIETPFGRTSDAIVETTFSGVTTLILSRHGPGHLLNPSQVPYRANIFALKSLGCTHILASGAVGSLRDEFKPKDLVLPDQAIDKTYKRAGTFYEHAAVHVEFAEPFDAVLRQILKEAGKDSGFRVPGSVKTGDASPPEPRTLNPEPSLHDRACYVCMEGPAFSTRAESLMHRLWGGDLIGMTAMPEAKLAREAEIPYALLALVTDYDCWKTRPAQGDALELLKEIMSNLKSTSEHAIALMRRAIELMPAQREQLAHCAAHDALKLAVWSDKTRIPREEIERLRPLWGKYSDVERT